MIRIIIENIRLAFESIKSQKIRALITLLIIAFGIMALVGTLTVVKGIDNSFTSSLQSLGSNKFSFKRYPNNFLQGRRHPRGRKKINPRITYRNALDFKKRFKEPDAIVSLSFAAGNNLEIKSNEKKSDPSYMVVGVDAGYMTVNAYDVDKGRTFTEKDIKQNYHFAIIGSDLVKELFDKENPVNKEIIIHGNRFKIIGILKNKQATFGGSENNRIFIPINLARSIFSKKNANYRIYVAVSDKNKYDVLVSKAIALMRNIRKLKPSQANNFGITRSDKLAEELKKVTKSLTFFSFIIGLITILGSSIALMNIMLVSVTERTREIGIRKALGANRILVMLQFFIETLTITLLGGLVGIISGIFIGFGVSKLMHVSFSMPWHAIGIAFFVIFVVAIISGLYPAYKASKLDPIQSLRYE